MRYPVLSSFIATGALGAAASSHAGLVSTWIGPATGFWNNAANWNSGVPGSPGVTDAAIPTNRSATTVTLDLFPAIASLTLGSGC